MRASGRWIRGLAAAMHLRSGPKLVARTPRGAGSVSRRPERQETQKKPPDAARRTSSTSSPGRLRRRPLCKVTVTRARRRHAAGGWRASCGGGRVGRGAAFHRQQRSLAVHTGPGGGPPRWSPTALTLEVQISPDSGRHTNRRVPAAREAHEQGRHRSREGPLALPLEGHGLEVAYLNIHRPG